MAGGGDGRNIITVKQHLTVLRKKKNDLPFSGIANVTGTQHFETQLDTGECRGERESTSRFLLRTLASTWAALHTLLKV